MKERVALIRELDKEPDLSIYVTGSYGRLEAHTGSDLDPFFVLASADRNHVVGKPTKSVIDGELIKIARESRFP